MAFFGLLVWLREIVLASEAIMWNVLERAGEQRPSILLQKERTFVFLVALTLVRQSEMSGQNEKQDFAQVVDAHYERIFRAALSLARDRHLAEEVAQETFLAGFRKFDSFSGRSSVFTWLYRIMLNNYARHCRKRSLLRRLGFVRANANGRETASVTSANPSPIAGLVNSEERELLHKAMDGLPAKLRVVVAMHYFDDMPLREIADVLQCGLGTVKSRLFHARKRLCKRLQRKLQGSYEHAMP